MRKKIPVSYAVVGMYVDELCGNWIDTQKGKDTDQQIKANADRSEQDGVYCLPVFFLTRIIMI